MADTCNSCKQRIVNTKGSVKFTCPNCKKQDIVRCAHCREAGLKYHCPECDFEGPN